MFLHIMELCMLQIRECYTFTFAIATTHINVICHLRLFSDGSEPSVACLAHNQYKEFNAHNIHIPLTWFVFTCFCKLATLSNFSSHLMQWRMPGADCVADLNVVLIWYSKCLRSFLTISILPQTLHLKYQGTLSFNHRIQIWVWIKFYLKALSSIWYGMCSRIPYLVLKCRPQHLI